jgi:hypothetical protein
MNFKRPKIFFNDKRSSLLRCYNGEKGAVTFSPSTRRCSDQLGIAWPPTVSSTDPFRRIRRNPADFEKTERTFRRTEDASRIRWSE